MSAIAALEHVTPTAPLPASCAHRLGGDPNGLPCTNPDPHPGRGRGCTHASSTGSWQASGDTDKDHG